MDRRKFIQTSAVATAGMMMAPILLEAGRKNKNFGLQLYTLRDVIMGDVKGTLSAVAAMGYNEVETFGYGDGKLFGMPTKDFKAYMDSLNVKIVSGHYGLDQAASGWEKCCEDAVTMGQPYVVVPWMEKKYYSSLSELHKTCDLLNKAGEVANKYKLRMGYHNHAFEFEQVENKLIFDVMLERLDPKLVMIEMDIYWVVRAGHDPLAYFEKHPGRFQLWHVKDMDKSDPARNADVGTGSIDFKKIFARAKKAGLKKFFVEQESYPSTPIESTRKSIEYLKTIL